MDLVRFFCTHGRGLSDFSLKELKSLDKDNDKLELELFVEGKIAFKTNVVFNKLIQLKKIERLFLTIFFQKYDAKFIENVERFVDENFSLDIDSIVFYEIINNLEGNSEVQEPKKKFCRPISFRINFKTTGKWKTIYKNENSRSKIIQIITNKVQSLSPYFEVDLKKPLLEFSCHFSDTCLVCGLTTTRNSLSVRNYIKNVGLRSTICSSMLQLANFSDNSYSIILDPFCGKSTILTEFFASQNNYKENLFYLGSDSSIEQIQFSKENLNFKIENNLHDLVLTNILMNPYRKNFADLIISDLPFGLKHRRENMQVSTKNESELFYEKVLFEFDSLLVEKNGVAIILINANETDIFEKSSNKLHQNKTILLKIIQKNLAIESGNILIRETTFMHDSKSDE